MGVPLLEAMVGGRCLSFLETFFTGGGGENCLGGGGSVRGVGGCTFLYLHRCSFSYNKNDNNQKDHFTTCRCVMPCCAVLWGVSIGPGMSPFNFIAPSYQF